LEKKYARGTVRSLSLLENGYQGYSIGPKQYNWACHLTEMLRVLTQVKGQGCRDAECRSGMNIVQATNKEEY